MLVKNMSVRLMGLVCLVLTLLFIGAPPSSGQEAKAPDMKSSKTYTQHHFRQDFDEFWQDVHDRYAYFDVTAADWDKVRQVYGGRLPGIQTREQFGDLIRQAVSELSDPHVGVNDGSPTSPSRWYNVPSGADIWAEWQDNKAIITEVRTGSSADKLGLRAGFEVVSVNNVPALQAMQQRLGKCQRRPESRAQDWALRSVLAGHSHVPRILEVRDGAKPLSQVTLDDIGSLYDALDKRPLLEARVLPQDSRIGYIWLNNSLGDNSLIPKFDAALAGLKDTRGLILDLRGVPSGGNTTVARAIMSRFILRDGFYQKHDIPAEERTFGVKRSWAEIVSPRGPFCYTGPVAVLVDHWTGSVGEAIAIGFDGMHRAAVVGTPMAGLRGSVQDDVLTNTGITVMYQTERLFHVNGTPREAFVPPVLVVPADHPDTKQDATLDAGLKALSDELR